MHLTKNECARLAHLSAILDRVVGGQTAGLIFPRNLHTTLLSFDHRLPGQMRETKACQI